MTKIAGVCGWPVDHSLSPLIHTAWIEAAGLDARYDKIAVAPEAAADFFRSAGERYVGLNVTVPHKEAALAAASQVSDIAKAAGAANLLVFGSVLRADNTDGAGLLAALKEQAAFDPAGKRIVMLGAGGAARGAVCALLIAGARVVVVNRTLSRAKALADALRHLGEVEGLSEAEAFHALPGADLVVNATTLGLGGGAGPAVDLSLTPAGCVVMDMVYKPLRTAFLERAAGLGRPTVDGLAMLIGQARPSFEAFFGQPPDPAVDVRGLALEALGEA